LVCGSGSRAFVTGSSNGQFGTVAYEASSGAQLWADLYGFQAGASSIDVSPDGAQVFVTGRSDGDYATIAYSASSGTRQWVSFHDNGGAAAIAVSPDGTKEFVTGTSGSAYATIAYSRSSGATLWVSRFEGLPGRETLGTSIAVSPSGTRVFVTGGIGQPNGVTYGTVAYDASTGSTAWVSFYGGLKCCSRHVAWSLGVSGSVVFVTGESERAPSDIDYATVAYDALSGMTLWAQRFSRGIKERDTARSLVVSPDESSVYVTGGSGDDFATIGYEATTGNTLWTSRFEGFSGEATSIGVSPDATRVFVTGWLLIDSPNEDYLTIAYSTR
jgi:WD40 repeat protein